MKATTKATTKATEIVDALLTDLAGRAGGDDYLESIDPDTRAEMKQTWIVIVERQLRSTPAKVDPTFDPDYGHSYEQDEP